MPRGALEQWFAEYRSRSDFEALARVFDALAPKMLALARHLAPDAASAEDLVQATFLAAIEHRERFDPERDLATWLNGILTNKAKLARALRAREIEPDRLTEREEIDPALDAELREFVAALDTALQSLPEKYRAVLRGHLADGKQPEQLARELGLVPGTVRVQLHRGMGLLRKLLPPSFALGLVASLAPRGHAALRAQILHQAKVAAGAGGLSFATPFLVGGVLVNSKMVLLAIGVVLGLGGLLWFSNQSRTVESPAPTELAARSTEEVVAPTPVQAPAVVRSEETSSRAPASSDEPYGALDVEIVWHDGSPAAEVELELIPKGEANPAHAMLAVRSDATGHARVQRLHEGSVSVRVDRLSRASDASVTRGVSTTFHLELPRGVDVEGHVVDAEGRAAASAIVWLNSRSPFTSAPAIEIATTGVDGSFSIRSVDREALISATSLARGCSDLRPVTENMRADRSSVELVLGRACGSLEGLVRSADGSPIPGAIVAVKSWGDSQAKETAAMTGAFRTRTDPLGHYSFPAVRPSGVVLVIALANARPTASERITLKRDESKHLDLTLPLGVSVRGVVSDATGSPLAGVHIYDRNSESGSPLREMLRTLFATSDAAGRFELVGLDPGQLMLSAGVKIDGIERLLTTKIDAPDGSVQEWNPKFEDGLTIFGSVHDRAGAPLEGWIVSAQPQDVEDVLLPLPATTDAQGAFTIRNLRSINYGIVLSLPDKRTVVAQRSGVKPGPTPVDLVVEVPSKGDCFVHGRVLAPDGSPLAEAQVKLMTINQGALRSWHSELDGTFRLKAIQFGDQMFSIETPIAPHFRLRVENLAGGEDRDLGDIALPAGGELELTIVLRDGSLMQNPLVALSVESSSGPPEGRGILRSKDGRLFVAGNLLPGKYQVFPNANNVSSRSIAVEVRANETTRETIEMERGAQKVLFWFMSKKFPTMMGESHIVIRKTTGEVVLDVQRWLGGPERFVGSIGFGLPAGSYRIEATAEDGRSASHAFEVIEGGEPSQSMDVELDS